ncbi:MAG: UDP-N-acetylmuramate--L-alanine ligase [Candidatus Dormibacteria bacterium]
MRVHLVGIGGAALSALAHLYLHRGDVVTGSDAQPGEVVEALRQEGATVFSGHSAANLGPTDLVVTSTAVAVDNPELLEAARRDIPVVHRSLAAARLVSGHRVIAVAGTHGKTTTTTFVATVLQPMDPLVLSGGRLPGSVFNSRPGDGPYAVIEADESDGSFLALAPDVGVVTNIEADHLDHYRDLGEIEAAFEEFSSRVTGTLVVCVDDPGAARLCAAAPGAVLTYGFRAAEVQARAYHAAAGGAEFVLASPWGTERVRLPVPGPHNVRNAVAAACVGLLAGMQLPDVVEGLAGVRLPGRRLEFITEVNGARVFDDYGHHPTEVRATLRAARETCEGRLVCAFQPHRYSRLQALMDEFGESFATADEVILVPVYGAGEEPIAGVDSPALARAISRADPEKPVFVLDNLDHLVVALRRDLRPGDMAVCMGAGDICRASRSLARNGL